MIRIPRSNEPFCFPRRSIDPVHDFGSRSAKSVSQAILLFVPHKVDMPHKFLGIALFQRFLLCQADLSAMGRELERHIDFPPESLVICSSFVESFSCHAGDRLPEDTSLIHMCLSDRTRWKELRQVD